ncbi:class II fumarate hydratase [Catenovulum sp. 2E275]|uniref:class II fumarate hydratase n=1 Tax=Catenovulum sp. 2E275 TaxID=2980497 RepID=UPI0021D268D3|nr:class II fumarate hydratase [Catenovulum sp. 2E275]MCU4674885.1 class II fumarate hydratase [Catenovulum sp. 2E275]
MNKPTKFREIEDGFGKLLLPQNALYGAQTQRAVNNFNFSPRPMPAIFIKTLALIKQAAAQANADLNCITELQADYIKKAAQLIIQQDYSEQFPVNVFQTGSGTSTNMNMNEVLANLAVQLAETDNQVVKIHPNDQVNYGQSSNDVIPSCIQLSSLYSVIKNLIPAIDSLILKLNELSAEYKSVIKTGRTHLMDAMPLALGDEFATWAFQITECKNRLLETLPRLSQIALGGTAIGTGINAHPDFSATVSQHLTELIGVKISPCDNLAARISAQDMSVELHNQLKLLASIYIKLANDLRWMNSGPNAGLNELHLKALQPGSSIMPGKVNPVIPEAIIMLATEVIANDVCITLANQSGNFQLNVMLPLVADKMLNSIQNLTDASQAFASTALTDLEVNQQKLAEQAAQNPILATALNPIIGYEKASEIAKAAFKSKRSILDVAVEKTDLDRAELEALLQPEKLAKPRTYK